MGITFTRKLPSERHPGVVIIKKVKRDPDEGLTKMRFDGPLLDRPVQFPDDAALMLSWLRAKGLAVGVKDCQALWVRLSIDHYPSKQDPGDYAWLHAGFMASLIDKAHEHLVPVDAGDAVR